MSEHDDLVRLRHMLEYAREVVQFTEGKTRESLDNDMLLVRGLCYSIGVIGEAASRISPELSDAHPEIPWREIVAMRNLLIHIYFKVDNNVLWDTATVSVPALIAQLEAILPPDSPDDDAAGT